jgi:CspA family cold shock protein
MTGVVKAVVADRGFGFIESDSGGRDLFFRYADLQLPLTFDSLSGGERVVFDTEQSQRGPRAVRVRPAPE